MRNANPLYRQLASLIDAMKRCERNVNTEWRDRHESAIDNLVKNFLPSGSGIDNGTTIDVDASSADKVVLTCGYHHMNENGMYDGWTQHTITITSSLMFGINIKIGGRNRNDIKDYLHDVYREALTSEVWQDETGKWYSSQYETKVS